MVLEQGIQAYSHLLKKEPEEKEVIDFFLQRKRHRCSDGFMIKGKEFKRLENKFSKKMVMSYCIHYFQFIFGRPVNPDVMETVIWDTAQLSIADYLCKNGKESVVFEPLFTCIDHLFSDAHTQVEEREQLDAFFWNSYNRGIAYEDNSLFASSITVDFFPSYLFNQPLGHKEITKKYSQLIEQSVLPIDLKEEYIHKLQHIAAAPDNDLYLQY